MGNTAVLRCSNCRAPFAQADVAGGRAVCGYCGSVTVVETGRPAAPGNLRADASVGKIVKQILAEFKREQGVDLSGDENAMRRIIEAANRALRDLNIEGAAEVNLPFITADANGPRHLNVRITKR